MSCRRAAVGVKGCSITTCNPKAAWSEWKISAKNSCSPLTERSPHTTTNGTPVYGVYLRKAYTEVVAMIWSSCVEAFET